ncbi:hypothetical protein SAMN06295970_11478 [Noviherbaspirillum suwonense]|jgi:hypothetical protein|uniref:Uncharacterized protein n=1 Tax=Noviherbaspirillum suwonense TaxID=1224511 RepID=A0ABY1QET3_9BURK|nr:hypothetical protein SAMN06295970_11478 [Noviherbaspirillum suwonense]
MEFRKSNGVTASQDTMVTYGGDYFHSWYKAPEARCVYTVESNQA